MNVLGNVRARRGEILDTQRSVVSLPGRLNDMEPVSEEAELVPDERALPHITPLDHIVLFDVAAVAGEQQAQRLGDDE